MSRNDDIGKFLDSFIGEPQPGESPRIPGNPKFPDPKEFPFSGIPAGTQQQRPPLTLPGAPGSNRRKSIESLIDNMTPEEAGVGPFSQGERSGSDITKFFLDSEKKAKETAKLTREGVDVFTGAGLRQRILKDFTPEDKVEEFYNKNFESVRFTDSGQAIVGVANEDGSVREVLFDEAGFSVNDLADASEEITIALSSIGGLAGLINKFPQLLEAGVVNLGKLSIISGVSGQSGAAIGDVVAAINRSGLSTEVLSEIAIRRGENAGVDALTDFLVAGGLRIPGKLMAPNSRFASLPENIRVKEAADKFNVNLPPGVQTGAPTAIKAETLRENLPGFAEDARIRAGVEAGQIKDAQKRLADEVGVDSKDFGKELRDIILKDKSLKEQAIFEIRGGAEKLTLKRVENLKETMSSRPLSQLESGRLNRDEISLKKQAFKGTQNMIEDGLFKPALREIPAPLRNFAKTSNIKSAAEQLKGEFLRSSKTTKETVKNIDTALGGQKTIKVTRSDEIIKELANDRILGMIKGIEKLPPDVAYPRLRSFRNMLDRAIENQDVFPGVTGGQLLKLRGAVQADLKLALENAPSEEVKKFGNMALEHYSQNIDKFQRSSIIRALEKEGAPGAIRSADLLPGMILKGDMEGIQHIIEVVGKNAPSVKAAKRNALESLTRSSSLSTLGDKAFDAKSFATKLEALPLDVRKFIFGDKEEEIGRLVRLMGAKQGTVDLDLIKNLPGDRDIADLLIDASRRETSLKNEFKENIFKKIINDEADISTMNPADFTRFIMKGASEDAITVIMSKLNPVQKGNFRRSVMSHIMDKASKGAKPEEALRAGAAKAGKGGDLIDDPDLPKNLRQTLRTQFGADAKESLAKVEQVLGKDMARKFDLFADLMEARKRKSGNIAGGFAGSSILLNFMREPVASFGQVLSYKVLSTVIGSNAVEAILKSPGMKPTAALRILQTALPQITQGISQMLGFSEIAKEINSRLADNLDRIDEELDTGGK